MRRNLKTSRYVGIDLISVREKLDWMKTGFLLSLLLFLAEIADRCETKNPSSRSTLLTL